MAFGQLVVAWTAALVVRGVGLALSAGLAGAASLALAALVAALAAIALRRMRRRERAGRGGCVCGSACDGCGGCAATSEAPADLGFCAPSDSEEPADAVVR